MDISIILERVLLIGSAILQEPLIYFPLIGSWILTSIYYLINSDEGYGHSSAFSNGIAHIFTAYMISPLIKSDILWEFTDLKILITLGLFAYGVLIITLSITQIIPEFLAGFIGDPGHALVPSLMAILYVDQNIPFDLLTFAIIAIPVGVQILIVTIKKVA